MKKDQRAELEVVDELRDLVKTLNEVHIIDLTDQSKEKVGKLMPRLLSHIESLEAERAEVWGCKDCGALFVQSDDEQGPYDCAACEAEAFRAKLGASNRAWLHEKGEAETLRAELAQMTEYFELAHKDSEHFQAELAPFKGAEKVEGGMVDGDPWCNGHLAVYRLFETLRPVTVYIIPADAGEGGEGEN